MAGNTRHVVNMANSVVGVSILSMPYCFKESGLLLGVLMVLFSGFVTKKTCMFLVRAATMARHHSYEFLAFHVFGVRGKLAVELCMILFLIGICISFHVVMGDLAPALVSQVFELHNTPSLRATLLLGIAVLVVLPLCLLRKLDNLASMSACSILFYFFLITVIFWHAFPRLVDGSWYHLARLWRPSGVLQVFPICMLGLSCQSNVFEIYDSVQDPDVPKMRSVVNSALNLCCALYISVGFFGYIAFVDQDMAGNIIMNLPPTPLTEGIKLFFTASLAISFPLMIFPCRTSIHSLFYSRGTQGLVGSYMPEARFKGITVCILAISLVVGILIPNIEFVLGMLGSTMGVVISLVLPCVMFIKVNSKASVERLVAQGIMLMGVVLIVSGTYLNLTHTEVAAVRGMEGGVQPVIAVPPALLGEGLLLEKEGGGVGVRRHDPAPAGVEEGRPAPLEDLATRKEPVAPEPPPEDLAAAAVAAKAAVEREAGKEAAREGGAGGDSLHPDAIQKEEKEAHREGGGGGGGGGSGVAAGARVEYKQQELLKKIEVQHQEQQKILAEQKQILQELKDQKAQQELQDSLRAAAAPQQPNAAQQMPNAAAAPQQPNAAAPQLPNAPPPQLANAAPQLPAAAPQQLVAAAPQAPAAAAPQQFVAAAPQLPAVAPPQLLNAVPQQPVAAALQQSAAAYQAVPAAAPVAPQQLVAAAPQQPAPALPQQPLAAAAPQQPVAPAAPQQPVAAAALPQQPVAPAVPQQPVAAAALPQQPVAAAALPQQPVAAAALPQQPVAAAALPQQPVAAAAPAAHEPVAAALQQSAAAAPAAQQPVAPALPQQPVAAAPAQQPVAAAPAQQPVAAAPAQQPVAAAQQPVVAAQQPVAAAPALPQQPVAAAPAAPAQQPVAPAAAQQGSAVGGVGGKAVVSVGAVPSRSTAAVQHKAAAPQLPHYPGVGRGEEAALRGPQAYLEKVSQAAPAKPRRTKARHDEERRKRAAGPDPALQAAPAPAPALPPVDLKTAPAAAAGLSEAAYESRHLLWGNSRTRRRRRRGGQRGGDEEYWDET